MKQQEVFSRILKWAFRFGAVSVTVLAVIDGDYVLAIWSALALGFEWFADNLSKDIEIMEKVYLDIVEIILKKNGEIFSKDIEIAWLQEEIDRLIKERNESDTEKR